MNLKTKFFSSIGLLGLLCLMLPNTARADNFTFTVNGGSGTLSATNIGGGMWVADSGTAIYNLTAFTLYAGTDNGAIQTSPSGGILFDNVLYPNSNPTLDVYGLLFIDANANELNIYGGPNVVQTFKLTAVPEPGTISLFLSGMLGLGLLVGMNGQRRNPRVGEA